MNKISIILIFILIISLSGCSIPKRTDGFTTSGIMLQDETWSGEIYITGDIFVPSHITLTIMPGTTVYIAANQDDQNSGGEHILDEITTDDPSAYPNYTKNHINILVQGELVAVGTAEEKITFTSDSKDPQHTDWDGITIKGGSGEMKHCIVEYSHTGPAVHDTSNFTISHCTIQHIFWGGLHAFSGSPVFEYNYLNDFGHEALDTHKASPIIKNNYISHARSGFVFNYYDLDSGEPIIFENNIIENSSNLGGVQENSYAIIRNNIFIGSNNTGGPWTYKNFTLDNTQHSLGIHLADNVNINITNNTFTNIYNPIDYIEIGGNKGIGHTTNTPEPFEITGPVNILIEENYFDEAEFVTELEKWKNVYFINNSFN
jgi:hypothetical protein